MGISPKAKGLLWIAIAGFTAFLFLFLIPRLAKSLPWSWEEHLARQISGSFNSRACNSSEGSASLSRLKERLLQTSLPVPYPVQIEVIPGNTENAFASFGGRIYVYEGLIEKLQSGDELAGVLAHEIEHVEQRHIIQGAVSSLFSLAILPLLSDGGTAGSLEALRVLSNLKFSRTQEAAADQGALLRLKAAQIDNLGFARFFDRLSGKGPDLDFFSDHPSSKSRSELAKAYQASSPRPVFSVSEWEKLKRICHSK